MLFRSPGTTRDVIEESVTLGPWPLVLQDTAGVREAGDEVERIGIGRTMLSVASVTISKAPPIMRSLAISVVIF